MADTSITPKVQKTEAEWRELLTPEQFHIMREKGTEPPFSGALLNNHDDGVYHCAACDAPLFTSDKKFESGSGWPSFWLPVSADAIEAQEDNAHGMRPDEGHARAGVGSLVRARCEPTTPELVAT